MTSSSPKNKDETTKSQGTVIIPTSTNSAKMYLENQGKLPQNQKEIMVEEAKDAKKPDKLLKLEAIKAAIKIAIKCKPECGFELLQGFATNLQNLSADMGGLNTVKHILPKIPLLLVKFIIEKLGKRR